MNISKPTAYFRFYASAWRGAGHAMRSTVLADALVAYGWECVCVTETESYEFLPALSRFMRVDPDVFYNTPPKHDVLVVDHYECGYDYEHHFRNHANIILVIDDLADKKHDCDIIQNQSYGMTRENYAPFIPPHCVDLMGPVYALMKPIYAELRAATLARRKTIKQIDRVLLNFGGNDQKNMILESLKALKKINYIGAIDVAFGMMAPHRESVEDFAKTMPNEFFFHVNPDMPALMARADFAIGAPAVTQWERMALGLPTLLIQTADNQTYTYGHMLTDGYSAMKSLEQIDNHGWFHDFDAGQYQAFVQKYADQTEGIGAQKLMNAIELIRNEKNDLRQKTA